jgi:uncharacterized repeat protein (TIGR03803 family)
MKTKLFIAMLFCTYGSLNTAAQTQLWGTAEMGGATGDGVIFTTDANGANYHVEYSLVDITGSKPRGNVVLANNGKLYGVTERGGFGDSCVIYSYDPSTGVFSDIHDLYQYMQLGYGAMSAMIEAADGSLYGLCPGGGAHGGGVIYKIDPATDTYTDIYDFSLNATGYGPKGTLMEASNGKLYGITNEGGTSGAGVIFSFDPITSVYAKLHDFNLATGAYPLLGGLIQASNLLLYGMTKGGGNNLGVIFSFDIATGNYYDLYDFDGTHGSYPCGNLMQANDGILYGMSGSGGANASGTIFRFDPGTNVYMDLFDFDGTNGYNPQRGLRQAANGTLYGTSQYGGIYNAGVAFSYDILTSTFTKLVDFNYNALGAFPDCDLVETPILTPTGIPAIVAANGEEVYPNPATSSLTVTGTAKEEEVQFFDVAAKELLSLKISAGNKTHVDITGFPNLFFMKRQNGEVSKIVKE